VNEDANNVTSADTGTVDTLQKSIKNPKDWHKYWLAAIQLADKTEKDWREDAKVAIRQFRSDKDTYRTGRFNILYANMQTICPAIYNSWPEADVRARFGEAMPVEMPPVDQNNPQAVEMAKAATAAEQAKADALNKDRSNVSQSIERGISVQADLYDYDDALRAANQDRELLGRAITRVRVNLVQQEPTTDQETGNQIPGAVVSKHVTWEPVQWDQFRLGPAKQWADTPWIAFGWPMTRDELEGINDKLAWKVKLDLTVEGQPDKDAQTPDMFKRAMVWEIWDRTERKVYWLAESYDQGPLKVEDDPYKLRQFFPIPKPLVAIRTTDTQVPICPFSVWQAQQTEMDSLTRRIGALISVIRWRGVYDGAFEAAVNAMKNLDEGELAPAPQSARALVEGDIAKAFWLMPIKEAIETLKQLYESRELCKQVIYELTGVADILRGASEASETATAQQLKAQWGSLRLQDAQRAIQVHARDLMRLTADLMGLHFTTEEMYAMTGIQLTPSQEKLFRTDIAREFNLDIETDGTIKADLSRAQENVGGFVTGLGGYFEAVGPAVQARYMTPVEAVGLARTFARNFKLGRQADHILDEWQKRLEAEAKQPPPPPPPDPKVQAAQIKAQADAQAAQAEVASVQMKAGIDQQMMQMEGAQKEREFQMDMTRMDREDQRDAQQHAMQMQTAQQDQALKERDQAIQERQLQQNAAAAEHGHGLKMEVMDAQAKAKRAAANAKPKGNGAAK